MAEAAPQDLEMPLIDEDVLRRLRGEPPSKKASRSYYSTPERWAAVDDVMKQLGTPSLNKFLDEVVSIFMLALQSDAQEDVNDVNAAVRNATERRGTKKPHRAYYTSEARWTAIEAAVEKFSLSTPSFLINAAVEYFLAYVREDPKRLKPAPVTDAALKAALDATAPKKRKK